MSLVNSHGPRLMGMSLGGGGPQLAVILRQHAHRFDFVTGSIPAYGRLKFQSKRALPTVERNACRTTEREVLQMPAKSEKQRKFMGAELQRKREGKKTQTGMSEKELEKYASKKKD